MIDRREGNKTLDRKTGKTIISFCYLVLERFFVFPSCFVRSVVVKFFFLVLFCFFFFVVMVVVVVVLMMMMMIMMTFTIQISACHQLADVSCTK